MPGTKLILTKMASPTNVLASGWTNIWESGTTATSGELYGFLVSFNTTKIDLRLVVNGLEVFSLDLDELKKDFKLTGNAEPCGLELFEYAPKRWRFSPPRALYLEAGSARASIDVMSHSGTKKLLEGLATWGEP